MPQIRRRVAAAAVIAVAALPCLSGCAGLLLANNVAVLAHSLPSNEPRWVEANRLTFAYPAEDVYAAIEGEVQRVGLTLVERDAPSRSLLVSYPFSWLKNNWGGSLKITCIPGESGTTVTVLGDGRDAVARVRALGDTLLDGVNRALRRLPRSL